MNNKNKKTRGVCQEGKGLRKSVYLTNLIDEQHQQKADAYHEPDDLSTNHILKNMKEREKGYKQQVEWLKVAFG